MYKHKLSSFMKYRPLCHIVSMINFRNCNIYSTLYKQSLIVTWTNVFKQISRKLLRNNNNVYIPHANFKVCGKHFFLHKKFPSRNITIFLFLIISAYYFYTKETNRYKKKLN